MMQQLYDIFAIHTIESTEYPIYFKNLKFIIEAKYDCGDCSVFIYSDAKKTLANHAEPEPLQPEPTPHPKTDMGKSSILPLNAHKNCGIV